MDRWTVKRLVAVAATDRTVVAVPAECVDGFPGIALF